jgi:hypothetical protein
MKKLRLLTRLLLITFLFSAAFLLGQTTDGTGSIVGTVIDVMFAFLPSDVTNPELWSASANRYSSDREQSGRQPRLGQPIVGKG